MPESAVHVASGKVRIAGSVDGDLAAAEAPDAFDVGALGGRGGRYEKRHPEHGENDKDAEHARRVDDDDHLDEQLPEPCRRSE